VRAADVKNVPVTLRIAGQIAAGAAPEKALSAGEAMQINTGAPMPAGADAVVRVERTEPVESGDKVLIREAAEPGKFVTPRATYVMAGQTVLEAGTLMTPLAIGAAASAGAARVKVFRRPTVAVLATGDELVEIEKKPTGAQIRNSNEHLLNAMVGAAHVDAALLGVARDEHEPLRARITEGLRSDVLCVTGGISMGAFDFVPDILRECGVRFRIHKMAIKPGRPTIFGTLPDGTLVFALPGNPAGTFVTFELLVRPALAALQGRPNLIPTLSAAVLRSPIKSTRDRRTYLPARAWIGGDGGWVVEALSWHGSGDSFGMVAANALIMRPPCSDAAASGETVSVLLLDRR
jgi:molybdopterin molybdotransferase